MLLRGRPVEPVAVGDGVLIHRLTPLLGCSPQSAVKLRKARQISWVAASSLGKRRARLDELAQ